MLQLLDWLTLSIFVGGTLTVGLLCGRGRANQRDYFLGSRALSWWSVGLSIVATETSALTIIGVPALAFGRLRFDQQGGFVVEGGDLRFVQLVLGYIIARVVVARLMVPRYFAGEYYTPYALIGRQFGEPSRRFTAIVALLSMTIQAGARVYVTAIPLTLLLGTSGRHWGLGSSMLLLTILALVLTWAGGVRAVVWTDVLQFFVFAVGGLYALQFIPSQIVVEADNTRGWAAVATIAVGKFVWFDSGLAPVAEYGSHSKWAIACLARLLGGPFNIWMGLIGATFGVMVSHGADQLNVQRVLACKSPKEGQRALLLSALVIGPLLGMYLLIGVLLFSFYRNNGFAFGSVAPWDPRAVSPKPKADYVFPIFILTRVPSPMRGLLLSGICAAALSSLTSALTAIASVALTDLWQPWRGKPKTGTALAHSRWATLASAAALAIVGWAARDAALIFNWVFSLAGIFSGAKLAAILLSLRGSSRNSPALVSAMLGSCSLMLAIVFAVRRGFFRLNWPWYSIVGTLACIVAYRLFSRLHGHSTRPSERDK